MGVKLHEEEKAVAEVSGCHCGGEVHPKIKIARELSKVAEVRNLEKLKARFIIVDSKQIMFMLLDDEKVHPNYDIGVWVNTEFFSQSLEQLFELAWKEMKSVSKMKK